MNLDSHRIACIGGGTGLFTLLSGLKVTYPKAQISAVVSMMDSGGSTGRLRDEFGRLPPGDIRQCLVALSDAPEILRALMKYRFKSSGELSGHNLGNLVLTALKDIEGGEYEAIEAMEKMLGINGKVYPVTLTNCHLVATLSDGSKIVGETNIDVPKHDTSLKITNLSLHPEAGIFEKTREAFVNSDTIVVGPGDLFTSVMSNLVVNGVIDALKEAKKRGAKIIYIVNTMTKHGETDEYKASDFVKFTQKALDGAEIDAVIVNEGKISEDQKQAYAKENAVPVINDLYEAPYKIIRGDFVNKEVFARHNSKLIAKAVGEAIAKLEEKCAA